MKIASGDWDVFTLISFNGNSATLRGGQEYPTLASMGLQSPVKSMRPNPK